jgi:AcrR family transcriptional regulator
MRAENTRDKQAERVKTSILDAAIPLFARGFDSVSIKQIAERSGYKHSLVMYHFGTKEKLWEQAATRLMQRFDARHQAYIAEGPVAESDSAVIQTQLFAFIKALRDIPEYGQMLLSEGSQVSQRLQWLHVNFFPSAVRQQLIRDQKISEALLHTTLVRNVIAGAMLFTVVAAPQLASSAQLEGGEAPEELYPLSDRLADKLAGILTTLLLSQAGAG